VQHTDIDPNRLKALAQLLVDHPDLDVNKIRELVETPTGRKRRETLKPKSFGEITLAYEAGWITKAQALKLAGLTTQRRKPQVRS
jgi:ribosomal 50S subunit-associated protein YjgA (DUF615 family)